MELRARIPATLRRAAFVAALVALAAPATAGAATTAKAAKKKVKAPVVTKVSPLDVAVGETLTIRGRNFIKGRNKNTVVFKRDGARAVFAKAGIGTKKMLAIKVPASLQEFFATQAGTPQPTRFRIRVLAKTFAKKYTKNKWSPIVSGPRDQQVVDSKPDGDCDGDGAKNRSDTDDDNDGLADDIDISLGLNACAADSDGDGELDKWEFDCDRNGVLNRDQTDDDGDLLSDEVETAIGSNPCVVDTDGDGVEDGYEYQSAKDLNDDEYQIPNTIIAYPYKMPYPNPGFADAEVDYDGDGIALGVEYKLWKYTGIRTLSPLSYSDGMQYSLFTYGSAHNGRRVPAQAWSNYAKAQEFQAWTASSGYGDVDLYAAAGPYPIGGAFDAPVGSIDGSYDLRDVNLNGVVGGSELANGDVDGDGWVSDDERDEDADGLSNVQELRGVMTRGYWISCYSWEHEYPVVYSGTKLDDGDTDGDGIRDGADDQDHDDLPNLMELSRSRATGGSYFSADVDPTKGGCSVNPDLTTNDLLPLPDGNGVPDIKDNGNHWTAYGRVNPYNPCLPFVDARTCVRYTEFSNKPAPFDGSYNWIEAN